MEKLNLNSELLKPMKDQLEVIINRLANVVATQNKEAEITLKINLNTTKRYEEIDGEEPDVIEWIEPDISYQISEKIKEFKNTNKGNLGFDYELRVDEESNEVYVGKVNEQTSMWDD